MAKEWGYNETKTQIVMNEPPKQRLRITGHRIASVLGLNQYQTPFGAWAEITKLVKLPFEDNKYTLAGKAIEPKLIDYIRPDFPNVMSIEEYYGNNIEKYKWNNFVEDSNVFGGIIDAVATKSDLKTLTMIVECKTSSKPQAWDNNQVPIDYLLQGCLYSYLKGLDRVLFVCAFLQEEDYNHPEKFVPSESNVKLVIKKLKDVVIPMANGEYISFTDAIKYCEEWWDKYVETGISPEFDEKADKEYLDILRLAQPENDSDLDDLCNSAKLLVDEIERLRKESGIDEKEAELKNIEDGIKKSLQSMLKDGETKATYKQYTLNGTTTRKFDDKAFKEAKPKEYEKYIIENTTWKLIKKKVEEE